MQYGSKGMDNLKGLVDYGVLDDELWVVTPFSVPMPEEIANISEKKLEIAASFNR